MWEVTQGDSLDVLRLLPDACLDSLVTDPPAGIGFMGKEWDEDKGSRDQWIEWLCGIMTECLRVLKPGAHGLVWALPRTSHWTAMALEDAGFEIRDVITHHFGTGFPKSLDVSKAIDKAAGAKRLVVGSKVGQPGYSLTKQGAGGVLAGRANGSLDDTEGECEITAPATDAAKTWSGWGTALKPGSEHWILVRKPFDTTVASNVQEHGTGALNIDASRIGAEARPLLVAGKPRFSGSLGGGALSGASDSGETTTQGRWPANVVFTHSATCEEIGTRKIKNPGGVPGGAAKENSAPGFTSQDHTSQVHHFAADGTEEVPVWNCATDCPVRELDAQSGITKDGVAVKRNVGTTIGSSNTFSAFTDGSPRDDLGYGGSGGASRFFYCAKPSTREKEAGTKATTADGGTVNATRGNTHPTVKSIALMDYLVRLITPPGGVVLDPFAGSGTTGAACVKGGWSFLGIEKSPEYAKIATDRIGYWETKAAA